MSDRSGEPGAGSAATTSELEEATRPLRVVIADDSAALRLLLRNALRSAGGFELAGEAADGAEAVRVVVREHPDIAVIDLAMPVMDGLEAIPLISRLSPRTRIAVLSSFDASREEETALREGAHVYINKRSSSDEVARSLRRLWPERPAAAGHDGAETAETNGSRGQIGMARETPGVDELPRAQPAGEQEESLLQAESRVQTILRHQTLHLATIIGNSLDAVVGVDQNGRITTWSRPAERTFGWPADEVLGRDLTATLVPASLRESYGRWVEAYARSAASHAGGELVRITALRRDGREFPAELAISPPVRAEDGTLEFIGFVRDITERAWARRMRSMQFEVTRVMTEAESLEGAAPAVLEAVAGGLEWPIATLWLVSEAEQRLHQVSHWQQPAEDLAELVEAGRGLAIARGQTLPGLVWASGRPESIVDLGRVPDFVRGPAAAAHGITAAACLPIVLHGSVVGVIEVLGRQAVALDDTTLEIMQDLGIQLGQFVERMRALRGLREKAQNLERSNTDLEQFARIASHDLQEPLRTMTSYVQLLQRRCQGRLGEDADDYIGFIVDAAGRMQALIMDLLAYSRAARGVQQLTDIDTAECVEAARSNLAAALAETGAELVCGPLPTVRADGGQLTQLFQNLIGNAIKFHGEAPPRVEIGAQEDGRWWSFSVADNGIGIASEQSERIFEAFQRLHTREEYPGTGIGLALCRKVVERLGGRIWVESEPGRGSTFRFTLPAAEDRRW